MKLALASDHAGYVLKQHLVDYLKQEGHDVLDLGVNTDKVRADYPVAARAVGEAVTDGRAERGILVCGSGVGACVAANKVKGVYQLSQGGITGTLIDLRILFAVILKSLSLVRVIIGE